jgi:Ni/Co efflux regulator RcnB
MKALIFSAVFSAAAALALAASPVLAQNNQKPKPHHTATHVNRTVHTTRNVKVRRTVHVNRTPHKVHSAARHRATHHRVVHRATRGRVAVHVKIGHRGVLALRRNYRAPHRYHFGTYRRPHGWYAHRWAYGQRLPRAWFARNYWIPNYITFGLVAPPDGYQWVRVGNDAMLVDVDTGEIVRVVYDVFY